MTLLEAAFDGRALSPEAEPVRLAFDLAAGISGGLSADRLAGSAELSAGSLRADAALGAAGLDFLADRLAGTFGARCRIGFREGRPMRVTAEATGRDLAFCTTRERRISLAPSRAAVTAEVEPRSGSLDITRAMLSSPVVEWEATGRLEREGVGGYAGALDVRGRLRLEGALEGLRLAGVGLPRQLEAGGTAPFEVRFTTDPGGQSLAVGARIGEGGWARLDGIAAVGAGAPVEVRCVLRREPSPTAPLGGTAPGADLPRLRLEEMSAAFPGGKVGAYGWVDLAGDSMDLRVEGVLEDVARAGTLVSAPVGAVEPRGALRAMGILRGSLRRPAWHGRVNFKDLSVGFGPDPRDRVTLEGGVQVEGRRISLEGLKVLLGEDAMSLSGMVDLTAGRPPRANVRVDAGRLDLSRLLGLDVREGIGAGGGGAATAVGGAGLVPGRVGRWFAGFEADLEAHVETLDLGLLVVEKGTARVALRDGKVRLLSAVGVVEGGGVQAPGIVDLFDTLPALRLEVSGTDIHATGRVGQMLADHAPMLLVKGPISVSGNLRIPLLIVPGRPWPTGRLRVTCRDGRIQGPKSPDWLLRVFRNLYLDRYAFRVMAVEVVLIGGDEARGKVFLDSVTMPDMAVEIFLTSAGTLRVDASVDLLSSVNPSPSLFKNERPYTVRIYRLQEAWVNGRRVIHAGGFRDAASVTWDVAVRRNAVVQELRKLGGEAGKVGLQLLDRLVPVRALEELIHGLRRAVGG